MKRARGAVRERVIDDVPERATKRDRPAGGDNALTGRRREAGVLVDVGGIGDDTFVKRGEIGFPEGLFGRVLAREAEGRLGHRLHLVERRQDLSLKLRILDEFGADAKRGDRRPQVVRDGGQHAGTVGDETLLAFLHAVECGDGLAHVGRAGFGHRLESGAA